MKMSTTDTSTRAVFTLVSQADPATCFMGNAARGFSLGIGVPPTRLANGQLHIESRLLVVRTCDQESG